MSHLCSIFLVTVVASSLFAMDKDKKEDNSSKNPSYSYGVEPVLSEIRANAEKGEASVTYMYPDRSKTTYYRYKDSSNK